MILSKVKNTFLLKQKSLKKYPSQWCDIGYKKENGYVLV